MTAHDTPREFMAAHTEAFVLDVLGKPGRGAILEVGAGDGRLAARLAGRGHDVTAIESDAERAASARSRGVRVVHADFLGATDPPYPAPGGFAAVLFTRVLHHLDPLDLALDRANSRLVPGGLVVGEEFAWERADRAALAWLAGVRERAVRLGWLSPEPDPPRESLQSWRHYHSEAHRLHTGETMVRAVSERFETLRVEAAPYLYRYLCTRLRDTAGAGAFAAEAFEAERAGIAQGELPALGLRFVARARAG